MDILSLLNELQALAQTGRNYATNPYDEERYERILTLVSMYYGQVLDLPAEEIKPYFRQELGQITPKIGADAAVFDDDGRILLVKRADNGLWCLPCGWLNTDESPAEGAVRETREETGLDVRPVRLVDVFSRKASVKNSPHAMVAALYLCEVTGGTLRNSHESTDLRYWFIDEVTEWHSVHEMYARAGYQAWVAWKNTR